MLAVTPPRRYNALRQHEGGSYLTAVEWTGQTVTEVDMKRKLLPWTIEVPDHVYVLGYSYTCHTLNTTDIVLSFPPTLPLVRMPRPHTCINSGCQGYRFVLRGLHVTSYTYRYRMRWRHESAVTAYRITWNKRRLRHIHVNKFNQCHHQRPIPYLHSCPRSSPVSFQQCSIFTFICLPLNLHIVQIQTVSLHTSQNQTANPSLY